MISLGDVPRQLFDPGSNYETRAFREWLARLRVLTLGNSTAGSAVLIGGAKVVLTPAVTADSRIIVTSNVDGGTPGWLRVSARTAGVSFTITSSSGTDTSTVAWHMFEPAL